MIHDELWLELEKVASRYRRLRFWTALAVAWFLAALVGGLLWSSGIAAGSGFRLAVPLLCGVAAVLASIGVWLAAARAPGYDWVARQIESAFPELGSCLLAAVEQRPALPGGRFGFLQHSVIRQALEHAGHHPWQQVVPSKRMAVAVVANFATFTLFLLALAATTFWAAPTVTIAATGRSHVSSSNEGFSVVVEPGNAEIERGTSLLVLARVQGRMPEDSTLVVQSAGGEETRAAMPRGLEDPVFGGRIAVVQDALDYRVELGGQTTPTYHVAVFEYPRLERADARLVYPRYTGMEERLVQDVRTLSVVEGTQLTLICHLNKRVATAILSEKGAAPLTLVAVSEDQPDYQATLACEKSRRLKLELVDDAGRKNVQQSELVIQVVPNQPPSLKLVFPARDLEVSPLEEMDVKATAFDDFGLKRMGVTYALAGQPPVEVVLGENAAARERHNIAHTIRFEELRAEPDQLLAYHFWAEDYAPDGSVRQTLSDMYFAEVRHFEEIFRQGQQSPGEQQQRQQQQQANSQNGQQAQQLAQLQKEIINATWKLIRRETGKQPTAAFVADSEQIAESQSSALEQAEALAEKVQDEQSQEHVATVIESMEQAVAHLKTAHAEPSAVPLKPALAVEQAAYQALLKLRAREHEVVRQQQPQSSSSRSNSSARSQQQRQQLQQLDLAKEENRYEAQRAAQAQPEKPEDRETRQVLNRLRELARRQHDLNERLKDLQSALKEAETLEKKDEIRQQLKRLQEEQKQVLRDTDELQSRMETPENLERMSEERQQLEQTREQVRRASESLEQEMVTQAAASGTRAEKEFEDLRNEFRRRASGRFTDEMRQMRESARELDRRQKELGEQLSQAATPDPANKSLRDDGRRERIAQGLAQQKEQVSNLVERMRQTTQEAEQSEPLLSERLLDTARNVQDQKVDRALDATGRSVRQGLLDDARQQEQAAGRGIGQLREGIERAAEAVVGDETEALRRAREELRNLSEELNQEIARNSPNGKRPRSPRGDPSPAEGAQSNNREPAPGQPQEGEPNPVGERQPGQRGQGQQPSDQPQNGQPQRGQQQSGQPSPGGQQPGQSQAGQRPSQNPADGQRQPGSARNGQGGNPRGGLRLSDSNGGANSGPVERGGERIAAPIAGDGFVDFSDRLRDVEEMVDDPELRAEAARIRDRARSIRAEFKRHSVAPNWDVVRMQVAEPLVELADRVAEELLRRNSKQAIVPLDRDPVPPRYSEKTRRYYERLGSGK